MRQMGKRGSPLSQINRLATSRVGWANTLMDTGGLTKYGDSELAKVFSFSPRSFWPGLLNHKNAY
uniref:Uncharacterized protein n=2 Tax=Picea TaxID=3328 RepID=A0A124GN87_PICGL|nr:hypothetical protein ABT39_MTgene5062 [Picea glauca]QHR89753.1 hypothetical protein Q903MT_gene3775 [Picea sitchensis]